MSRDKDFERAAGHLYAQALMELAKPVGQERVADIRDDLDGLRQMLRQDERFRAFINSVIIDKDDRKASLRKIFAGKVCQETLHLLLVLCDHDRLMCLDEVCEEFQFFRDAQLKRAHISVTTAVPLDDDLRQRLIVQATQRLGRQPILHEHVKPSLLAGLVVQYEDWRADGSAARKLYEMGEHICSAGNRLIARGTPAA